MTIDTDRELNQNPDQEVEQDSEKDTAKVPDSEIESPDSVENPEGEEQTKEKLYTEEEKNNEARSQADTQMASYWKDRDKLRDELEDVRSELEKKSFNSDIEILYRDDVENKGEDEATRLYKARKNRQDRELSLLKNERNINETMKAIDEVAAYLGKELSEKMGIQAKNPVEKIRNFITLADKYENAHEYQQSFEFYLDLRDKGLVSASDKKTILKRLAAVSSDGEWEREKTRISQEYKARSGKTPYRPGSSEQGASGSGRSFTRKEISEMSNEEYKNNKEAIDEAQREGRIK